MQDAAANRHLRRGSSSGRFSPALAGLAGAMLLPSLGTSIANVALPELASAFAASFGAVQWIVLAYLIASTALLLGAGRLGDAIGRKPVLLAGIASFTAASAVAAAAPSLPLLIAARAAQGLGAAAMIALSMALVRESVPEGRTGSAIGLLGAASAVGTAIGPALGGLLLATLGWRSLFLVNLPLGLLAFLLVSRSVAGDRPDERGGPAPAIQLLPFRDRRLAAGLAMSVLVSSVMMATLIVGPFYLAGALGLGAAGLGFAMSAGPAVAAVASIPAGRLVDRCGSGVTTLGGLGAALCGCVLLALTPAALGVLGYVLPTAVVTAGYALFQSANNSALMAAAAAHRRGAVAGLLGLSRNLGLIAGASAMGAVYVFASGGGADAQPGAVAAGMHATFTVGALLILLAIAIATLGRRRETALAS